VFVLPVAIILINAVVLQNANPGGGAVRWATTSIFSWNYMSGQQILDALVLQIGVAMQQIGLPVGILRGSLVLLSPLGTPPSPDLYILVMGLTAFTRAIMNAIQWRIQVRALAGFTPTRPPRAVWLSLTLVCLVSSVPIPVFSWVQMFFVNHWILNWLNSSTYMGFQLAMSLAMTALATVGLAFSLGGRTSPGRLWMRFLTKGRGVLVVLAGVVFLWMANLLVSVAWYAFAANGLLPMGGGMMGIGVANEIFLCLLSVWVSQTLLHVLVQMDVPSTPAEMVVCAGKR
jgi:hypothetical protein